jgi:hypothetical protein
MASGLSDGVVICHGRLSVEFSNFGSEVCNRFPTVVSEHHLPGLLRVDFDALCNVVPVQAHPRHKQWVKFSPEPFIFSDCKIERPASLRGGISYLGPIVGHSLGKDGHEVVTESPEGLLVNFVLLRDVNEYPLRSVENSLDNEVGDLSDEPVDVINTLLDHN